MQITASNPQNIILGAATSRTSADDVARIVALREAGLSLRQIGSQTGRCMEGVRQVLIRVRDAKKGLPAAGIVSQDENIEVDLLASRREPMKAGHPIAVNAIWRGLQKWRFAS
ncbi:hypothetical protein HK17_01540 [Acetobacter indonesiensis]|uniref:Uncharacterized protein n=1 Tax=Acetobacter indonesiensis TaxID=104101 RepID=A0A252AGG4_9PROT|nr:hypothetical protein HK17_01540 [Acetobacter indonesiensis]